MPLVNILNPTTISPSSIYTTLGSGLPMSPVLTVPTGKFYNIKYAYAPISNPNMVGGNLIFSLDASGYQLLTATVIPGNTTTLHFLAISGNFYLIEGQSLYIRAHPTNNPTVYPTGAYVMLDIYT